MPNPSAPQTDFTVVIPARYASTRLPGKPLQVIHGKPMVQWVYERCLQAQAHRVVVATDDERIVGAVNAFGGEVCLTRSDHPSGTDRIQEVSEQLGLSEETIVVNVQGDEPLIPPAIIDQVAANLALHNDAAMATLSESIEEPGQVFNPNVVKVVSDHQGYALYFSRAAIPWFREGFAQSPRALPAPMPYQRHIGIYAYRVGFLNRYVQWPPAPVEELEALEQLRALYFGERIHVATARQVPEAGVDTVEDLERVRRLLGSDGNQQ